MQIRNHCGVGGEVLRRRSCIDLVWAGGTLVAIETQLFCCLAAAYLRCARKIGITPAVVGRELRGIGSSVLVQAIVTAASFMALVALGGTPLITSLLPLD